MSKSNTAFKIIKIVVSVCGVAVTIASNIIGERDLKIKVEEAVAEAVNNR